MLLIYGTVALLACWLFLKGVDESPVDHFKGCSNWYIFFSMLFFGLIWPIWVIVFIAMVIVKVFQAVAK